MVAFIVFLTCLRLTVSQDCDSGDEGSILQVQRQEREHLGTVFAQTPVVTKSFDPPLEVPDQGYLDSNFNRKKPPREDGARCVTFDVPAVPGADSMSVQLALDHTYVGDTVIFIKNPTGHVTVLKYGDTSPSPGQRVDLVKDIPVTFITSAPREASQMGDTAVGIQNGEEVACKMAPEQCSFKPEPSRPSAVEPGTTLKKLDELAVNPQGTWKICIGDDAFIDQGFLHGFNIWIPRFDPNNPGNGDAVGDPHIDTLQGEHYLLSKQGTFSLWELSGLDAEIRANHIRKQVPIDFKVYAHYSGHASYTKALLLLDQAANVALEITAKDCQWRSKTATGWSAVDASQQLLSVPDADGDHMTGMEVDGKNHIKFMMKEAHGSWQDLGNLSVRCKPGHFLNTKLSMPQRYIHLVGGQLGGHREGKKDSQTVLMQGAAQQGRTDQEFRASKTWLDLGGSAEADFYLKSVDEQQGVISLVSTACSKSQLEEARSECEKHFGEAPGRNEVEANHFANALESCAYDRCHGADEIAMELAAEIWHAD